MTKAHVRVFRSHERPQRDRQSARRGLRYARSPLFADVPTLNELGFPNLAPVYFGFVAPAGTPKSIIEKLHEDISRIGNEPAFRQKRLIDIGTARLIEDSGFQAR